MNAIKNVATRSNIAIL